MPVKKGLDAQQACKHIGLTVLMGTPLFKCSLHRKEYPKRCRECPYFEPRNEGNRGKEERSKRGGIMKFKETKEADKALFKEVEKARGRAFRG